MKHVSFLILCVLVPMYLASQNQASIWYFGDKAGLDFRSGDPVPLMDGKTYLSSSHNEGCSTISDREGNLLMYSNGEVIWNKNHEIMPNGNGLYSHNSSSQASLILPAPCNKSNYYVFTVDGFLTEKLTAVQHANGKDYWVISHKYWSNEFIAFQLSCEGIINQVTTKIGSVHKNSQSPTSTSAAIGHIAASPSGRRIGICFGNTTPSKAEVFDFDPATGKLSNWIPLPEELFYYGVAFSPDDSKVYFTAKNNNNGVLYQFNLSEKTANEVYDSKEIIAYSSGILGLQIGPNNVIYTSYYDGEVERHHTPFRDS